MGRRGGRRKEGKTGGVGEGEKGKWREESWK